jgi:Zn-dependent protease with chaperone function
MHPSPKLNGYLSLIVATVIGNTWQVWGAEPICSAALDPASIISDLEKRRPAPIGPDERAAALRAMPQQGRIQDLDPDDADKLHDLSIVLRQHDRQFVYAVVVVDLPQARVGLHGKSVILVSLPALRLLTSGEIQAVVAHEIGHEYVWDEYFAAKRRGDGSCLRRLEFFCDAVAVVTLRRAGLDPADLALGLSRLRSFNRQFGKARDEDVYPTVEERQAFIKEVMSAAKGRR